MFALLVNRCLTRKRDLVARMAQFFMFYGQERPCELAFVWGAPGGEFEYQSPVGGSFSDTILRVVRERTCLLGQTKRKGRCLSSREDVAIAARRVSQHSFQTLTVQLTHETAVLSAQRQSQLDLWFGWYREPGVDLVFVHADRQAIVAACGSCGCLFDQKLQLWLAEKNKIVAYELGSQQVGVIDGSSEKDSTATSSRPRR